MSKRTDIITALINSFIAEGIVLSANVTRRLIFLHECNDFPSISMTAGSETRFHYGGNSRLAQLSISIRAFTHGEDAVGIAEAYARSIESAIDTFAISGRSLGLHEARVLSLRTDEGLFEPHGIIDITAQLTYEVDV